MFENGSMDLPDSFVDFLNRNGIDPSVYATAATHSTPRYIRLKPSEVEEERLAEVEADLNCKIQKVEWLPGFFSIPSHVQIAASKSYRDGKIYGMDAASGAAVMALNVSSGDHVLDLCAAPGAKLCMLLDILGTSGSVTGVDVAKHRLAACRTMLQKYALGDRCRLFVADGTSFSLLPLQIVSDMRPCAHNCKETTDVYGEWTSKRPWKERKRARKVRNISSSQYFSGLQEPELIFYGPHSGVVGICRTEVYRVPSGSEFLDSGYDKA